MRVVIPRSEILEQIERIVQRLLDDSTLGLREDMLFEEAGDWDSIVQTQTVVAIESHFDIVFNLEELASLTTVGALLDTVEGKIRRAEPRG